MGIKRIAISALLTALILFVSPTTSAGTITGQITVSLTMLPGCIVGNTSATQIGTIPFPTSSNLTLPILGNLTGNDGSSGVTWTCSAGTSARITIDGGANLSNGLRAMKGISASNSSSTISYRMHSDVARVNEITANGTVTVIGTGLPQSLPIYGTILPPDQPSVTPVAGSYSDTVNVTMSW